MRKKHTLLFLLFITIGFAQIPTGYYNTATGSGYTLKTQLYNIINNNTNSAVSSSNYGGLWILYTDTALRDNYYENNGSLLDIYSEKPAGPDSYEYSSTSQQCGNYSGEGSCYNREHLMPQSVFNSAYPMYSDAHSVVPSDGSVNGARGNFPFGVVATANYTSTNGSKRGNNLDSGYSAGYSSTVFEPINEFKGDVARAMLYFVTRYENQVTSWTYDMFNGTSNQVYTDTFIKILLTWHLQDPVSPYEIAKNNAVYIFQGNRNPFIDNPSYVCSVWNTICVTLSLDTVNTLELVSIYPNPSNTNSINIKSQAQLDSITLLNINGQVILEIQNPELNNNTFTVNNLNAGFYFLKLNSNNIIVTKKVIIK